MKRDALRIAEAAYAHPGTQQSWLDGVSAAAQAVFDQGWGVFAYTYDATAEDWITIESGSASGLSDELRAAMFTAVAPPEQRARLVQGHRTLSVGTAEDLMSYGSYFLAQYGNVFAQFGCKDLLILNGAQPQARGVCIVAPQARPIELDAVRRLHLKRLCAHLAAGFRVDRKLASLAAEVLDASPEAEAILRPDGTLEHATGAATSTAAREQLRLAVARLERARGKLRDEDDRAALELWQGLVAGEWSLLDQFDRDGQRYIVAHRNPSLSSTVPPLTLMERQVVAHAALGHSNKLIAYELGISPWIVAHCLRVACTKLGVASRVELVRRYSSLSPPAVDGQTD